MENKYFAELARRLREEGISTGEETRDRLPILICGQAVINVIQNSDVFLMPSASGNLEADELCQEVSRMAAAVKEYTQVIERASILPGCAPDEPFRLLADFNGVALAAYERENGQGYQFATWDWDYDQKGVDRREYFINDYEAAKKDFAVRSGLFAGDRLFTDEQLAEVYRCIHEELDSGYEITEDRRTKLQDAAKQIEYVVPNLDELVMQSNEMELAL